MDKVVVGIVPSSSCFTTNDPFQDKYTFVNSYGKKIIASGGMPVGILLEDEKVNIDVLNMCDAFLIQGGNKVHKYMYEIIYYALKNNKPLLGICLGAQAIDIFSVIMDKVNINGALSSDNIINAYKELKEENDGTLLKLIPSPNIHGDVVVNRDNIDEARHEINIIPDSILHSIYKVEKLSVISLHMNDFKYVGNHFKVSAKAPDGVIEAIEYNNPNYFILGVHFHPELEENNLIFERLISEGEKRKTN